MLNRKYFFIFLTSYILLRVFSFYFSPATPLYSTNPINSLLGLLILFTVVYLLFTKNIWGWYAIAFEILLGGSGGYIGIQGMSLRTLLLIASLLIYSLTCIREKRLSELYNTNKSTIYFLGGLIIYSGVCFLNGYIHHHALGNLVSDLVPYAFFLYYFPLRDLALHKQLNTTLLYCALLAAVIGNALLIAFTFVGFSSTYFVLQDSYYHWYRDVALGKTTELPFHFYRLVLNEHLLLIPTVTYFAYQTIRAKKIFSVDFSILLILLAILSVNLTRSYMLALAVVYIALFQVKNWKRWLVVTALSAILFVSIFTGVHLAASRGQSLGWELFGLRLQSITSPHIEDSSLSRLLLLPKILDKIKAHPVIGEGLGDTVTVYSPVFKQTITTPHFDWGYLEIIAEMGIVGLILWGALLVHLMRQHIHFDRWIIGSVAALLVINFTAPAVFHVLAVIWFTVLLSYKKALNEVV